MFKGLTILDSIDVSSKRSSKTVSASAKGPDAKNAYPALKDSVKSFHSCNSDLQTSGKRLPSSQRFWTRIHHLLTFHQALTSKLSCNVISTDPSWCTVEKK